ncbi:hypothetical protein [Actinomadura sp. 9N215]|uniref:hypothetical protein n=1 Tax=Actinomadura sp. 9N215 TaxID=3375150 RepID=UPI003794510E
MTIQPHHERSGIVSAVMATKTGRRTVVGAGASIPLGGYVLAHVPMTVPALVPVGLGTWATITTVATVVIKIRHMRERAELSILRTQAAQAREAPPATVYAVPGTGLPMERNARTYFPVAQITASDSEREIGE